MAKSFFQDLNARLKQRLSLLDYLNMPGADENIRSNIPFTGPNVYILGVAIVIASVGLNVNSIPVIIGAMLISPLMSPIIGFGYALGTNDTMLLSKSLKNLGVMVGISLLASTLYFLLTPLEVDNPTELMARTNPSIYDVLIAFFGGVAGMLEISRRDKGTVMSGVAIATALMPPLCTVGYGLAHLNWQYATGALYLFFINSVFIALAAYLVVKFLKYPQVGERAGSYYGRMITYSLLVLIVIVPSVYTGYKIIMENNFTKTVRHFVKENQSVGGTYIYDYSVEMNQTPYLLELRLAGESLSDDSRAALYNAAEKHGIMSSQIVIHEDATIHVNRLNEIEIMKDWIAANEQQIKLRDDSIKVLSARMAEYEHSRLPVAQLVAELQAQYPEIAEVTVAQGAHVDEQTAELKTVVVLLHVKKKMAVKDVERIEKWLRVRLDVTSIKVVVL